MATASADRTVRLWSLNPDYECQKFVTLKSHEDVVNCVEFHPMGLHVASGSHDLTWRLWDLEKKKNCSCRKVMQDPSIACLSNKTGAY